MNVTREQLNTAFAALGLADMLDRVVEVRLTGPKVFVTYALLRDGRPYLDKETPGLWGFAVATAAIEVSE